jgi:hypothetical protein
MRLVLVSVLVLVTAACASVQPVPVKSGDTCYGCREVIADTRLAAELVDANGRAYVFSSPECLAKYMAAHPEERPKGLFVTDHQSGRMVHAEGAVYVRFVKDPNRGQLGYAAFKDASEAGAFAGLDKSATSFEWAELLKAAGQ